MNVTGSENRSCAPPVNMSTSDILRESKEAMPMPAIVLLPIIIFYYNTSF